METKITIYQSEIFGQIRTTTDQSGNPLFALRDITNALGIHNQKTLKERLDPKGIVITYPLTNGGVQAMDFVNEPNLYRCIFQSRKETAIKFQDWIFEEVLPSIRKNGGYLAGQSGTDTEAFNKAVAERANCIVASAYKERDFWRSVSESQQKHIVELENLIGYEN